MNDFILNNGVKMPQVGFGTFLLQGEDCKNTVREAVSAGYRMIDTAEAYGNEDAVGDGIKESGIDREELFLVTKVNFKSYEHTRETVKSSLRLLGTDYLDLVLLHWPLQITMPHGGTWSRFTKKALSAPSVSPILSRTDLLI